MLRSTTTLGHAIGLHHEQNRPDREDYVTIIEENIRQDFDFNPILQFSKYNSYEINSEGIPYDYDSIMHYGKNAFSKDRDNLVTIRTKDRSMQDRIGQRKGVGLCPSLLLLLLTVMTLMTMLLTLTTAILFVSCNYMRTVLISIILR